MSPKGFLGTGGSASYQVGSFGTHRAALSGQHQPDSSGFFVQGSAFYDRARNNYEIDVEVPDERGRLSDATVPRFHDGYEAMGLNAEVGWRNRPWADALSVKAFANQYFRDIQHNNVMTVPFGAPTSAERTYGGLLRWQKKLVPSLSLGGAAGYSYNRIAFVDTSSCVYDWYGNCIRHRLSPGELGQASDQLLWDRSYYARLVLTYTPWPGHQFQPDFGSYLRDPHRGRTATSRPGSPRPAHRPARRAHLHQRGGIRMGLRERQAREYPVCQRLSSKRAGRRAPARRATAQP